MAYIGNEPADRFTSIPAVQQFNGDASTTAFTLNRAVGSDQDLLVSVDGVIQDTAAYAVSNGTTLTFSAAPSQGTANIFVNHLGLTIGSVVHPASSALVATTGTFSDGMTITTADNTNTLELVSTDADASIGPVLEFNRNSSSPADNDQLGRIDVVGKNDADEDVDYARIVTQARDVTDGTEDGRMAINTIAGGGVFSRLNIEPTESVFNDESQDYDFRVESNGNANMLFVDGGNDTMAIGQAATTSATVTIKNKGDSTTNTLDLFNDNGNRTVSMQQDSTGNAKMRFQKNDGTFTTTIDANLGGILFGTDTAAANTLDDYEEGTFTGTLVSSGGGTITLESAGDLCFYTKVGGLVTIGGRLEVDSVSSPSGHLKIGGLPFNVIDTGEISALNAVLVNVYSPAANPTGVFGAEMDDNRTQILVRDGFGHTGGVLTCADHIDAGSNVAFTATYRAT